MGDDDFRWEVIAGEVCQLKEKPPWTLLPPVQHFATDSLALLEDLLRVHDGKTLHKALMLEAEVPHVQYRSSANNNMIKELNLKQFCT